MKTLYTEPYFKQINTMPDNTKKKIEEILQGLTTSEKIDLLESLGKKYRRLNSIRLNNNQMNRRVDERPDEIGMR